MRRHRTGNSLAHRESSRGALTLAVLAVSVTAALAAAPAEASAAPSGLAFRHTAHGAGDSGNNAYNNAGVVIKAGNGTHNQNNFAVNTPTLIRGFQHVSTGNNGSTNTQNGLCKKWPKICKINQQQWTNSFN